MLSPQNIVPPTIKHFAACVGVALALSVLSAPAMAQTFFADFLTTNAVTETATGTLNGVAFTLVSTFASPRPSIDNGGVIGGTTNGTFTGFNAAFFTPPLVTGDTVALGGASDFTITFAQAITNPTLHIRQLQSNRLTFSSGVVPAAFTLLSSDGDFTVSNGGTTIQGSPGSGNDANGSLFFAGTFTQLSWTAARPVTGLTAQDGYSLQISVAAPEPASFALLAVGAIGFAARRKRRAN